ncbi:MAG: hypothetical protein HOV80_12025 [Polyangiaceae bacterium]|nr:hypothetical protein [Polyangiaceae bacterium]
MSKASIVALHLAIAGGSLFGSAGCGREDYLPATPDEFDPRTPPDNIAVIEADHEDRKTYKHIGTVMVKARKSNNAIKGCRTVAAEHGGDAIEIRPAGDRELKCLVLRRKDVRIED